MSGEITKPPGMIMKIISLISCAFILTQLCDSSQESFFRKVKTGGSNLVLNVLSSETVSSMLECSHRCLRVKNCTGFNHKSAETRIEKNCQLLVGDMGNIQQTSIDTGKWTLYKALRTRVVNQTTCPDGWFKLFSSCYYFQSTRLNWDDARSACQSLKGDLFIPDDSTEQHEIWRLSQARTPPLYFPWIGVRLPQPNTKVFYTVNGVPTSYTNWALYEPNYLNSEFCVVPYSETGKWNNVACHPLHDYICERNQTIKYHNVPYI
ncbi:C-type lectin domain family 3 member A-like [Dendronephthya gigantea]|uniref:C-type lectin domain family 3 member A-like n=1 Tax=Dendronephthya gigantea TaxID=151771 RepID=UPI00106CBDEF|nr:C-type lectin domain family 3 member A-like [Dendronephthya gigantea]